MSSSKGKFPHVTEILRIVCEHLHYDKAALACLARTSRMFEEPALDALWCDLVGLYHLAQCLPEDAWREESLDGNDYSVLNRPLIPTDCVRLMNYARKVKTFTTDSEGGMQRVDSSIYEGLLYALPSDQNLFPNIWRLTLHCMNCSFTFSNMFLGPRLTHVEYTLIPESSVQLSFLTALSARYTALQDVTVSFYDGESTVSSLKRASQFISSAVYKWGDLRHLKVPILTYAALIELRKLPRLEILEIQECDMPELTPVTPDGTGFPSLIRLQVAKCNTVTESIAVLNLLNNTALGNLNIWFKRVLSSTAWKEVLLTIGQRCLSQSLGVISCRDGIEVDEEMLISNSTEMISADVLTPLLAFHKLKFINIEVSKGFYFPDPAITAEFAQSWTNTMFLDLLPPERCRFLTRPTITLPDLIPFAKHCPHLQVLGLPINTTSLDAKAIRGGIIHENGLLNLVIRGDSLIGSPGLVAAHLSEIFPSLAHIEVYTGDPVKDKQWEQVEELVTLFSTVRRQDRLHYE